MLIWLKHIRIIHNITQKEVAARADITLRYYQMIEQGKYTPSIKIAKRIAEVLQFDWSIFYQEEQNEQN